MVRIAALGAGMLVAAAPAAAQSPPEGGGTTPRARRVEMVRRLQVGPGDHTVHFSMHGDAALGGKPMKGAPFSATAVTEMEQALADGNRIRQKHSAALARDSSGRTRREMVVGAIGPLVAPGEPRKLVHLHDPNSGASTTLDPGGKKAFRHRPPPTPPTPPTPPGAGPFEMAPPAPPVPPAPPAPPTGAPRGRRVVEEDVVVMAPGPGHHLALGDHGPMPFIEALPLSAGKPVREELGTQTIEGVRAEGTRSTLTIPAGSLGNDRPLVVVSERWYSPELGLVVMSRHSDPRLGTTTYRLTGIDRREPPAPLFEVPSDYAVQDGPAVLRRRVERPAQ